MSKLYGILFLLLVADYASSTLHPYVYEFGVNYGDLMYQSNGKIPLFQPETKLDITMPYGATITYVRVKIYAISPPKVDYEADKKQVIIRYDWTQISYSKYELLAKGVYM